MIRNKKGLAIEQVGLAVVSVLTLVVLLYAISSINYGLDYQQSIVECNTFMSNIDNSDDFFEGTDKNEPTNKFVDVVSSICHSKTIEIGEGGVDGAVELVEDCWRKSDYGRDLFSASTLDAKICLYCGRIRASERIENFKSDFSKAMKSDKMSKMNYTSDDILNLNNVIVEGIGMPETFEEDDEIAVYYYITRPEQPADGEDFAWVRDNFGRHISNFIGDTSSAGAVAEALFLEEALVGQLAPTSAGVLVTQNKAYMNSDFENIENAIETEGCYVIYPKTNHE